MRGKIIRLPSMNRKYGLKSFVSPIVWRRFWPRQQEFEEENNVILARTITRRLTTTGSIALPVAQSARPFYKCLLSSFRGVPWHVRYARTRSLLFLPTVIDALVIVQAVERPEHLVAKRADRAVQGLKVLLLFVPFQGELRRESLAAHVARVTNSWW